MEADAVLEADVSFEDVDTNRSEMGSYKIGSLGGEAHVELTNAGEILTRIELDLACTSEKLYNLNVLMMHVATREAEFEALDPGEEENTGIMVEKGMELDLLSGILDSEVGELDSFTTMLQEEILDSRKWISSFEHPDKSFLNLEEKLCDPEKILEQLREQLLELKAQSAVFQETLSCFIGKEKRHGDTSLGLPNGGSLNFDSRTRVPTAEQQMHFLRMLEKSLARELELEKKLSEARQGEEELKQRLQSAEQEAFCLEEEVFNAWERLFEADNSAEVLLGTSKELSGRLQISQFNLNGLTQRESDLRSKLEVALGKLRVKENALQELERSKNEISESLSKQKENLKATLKELEEKSTISNLEASTIGDEPHVIEREMGESQPIAEITEMQSTVDGLKRELSEAEKRAEGAEAKSKLLEDANKELHEELCLLRSSGLTPERVQAVEKQLKDSDILLQRAVAAAEASEEKQSMLYSAISDMESIIEDLKRKVSKAESRADGAEEKCIIISESNAELNEDLSFLRSRIECLEGSLHYAEETKLATAKSVAVHTRAISNLMTQLAMERERLHCQLTLLAKENRILVVQLQQNGKCSSVTGDHDGQGEGWKISSTVYKGQVDDNSKRGLADDTEVADSDLTSQTQTTRRIDVGVLSFKHVLIAGFIVLIATSAYLYFCKSFLLT